MPLLSNSGLGFPMTKLPTQPQKKLSTTRSKFSLNLWSYYVCLPTYIAESPCFSELFIVLFLLSNPIGLNELLIILIWCFPNHHFWFLISFVSFRVPFWLLFSLNLFFLRSNVPRQCCSILVSVGGLGTSVWTTWVHWHLKLFSALFWDALLQSTTINQLDV